MKRLIYILTFALITFSFITDLVISTDEKLTLSQEQKDFARKVSNDVGILKAAWANTYVLDVIYEEHWYGVIPKTSGKTQATLLATQGYIYINKTICVKILDYKLGELGYACVGDQSET